MQHGDDDQRSRRAGGGRVRMRVTVERHVVTLHGDAGSLSDVKAIGRAVASVPGVVGVRSALHVGLLPGDTRPSWGRRTAGPSPALRRLLEAADRGGVVPERAAAVAAVLSALATWLDREEWRRVGVHLPEDVRAFGRRRAHHPTEAGTDVVTAVAEELNVPAPMAAQTVRSVAAELAELVPASADAIATVLPDDVRGWQAAR
jgi:uncharacterized protein (DUF2267 family)